jgi:CubicO group peptidase (beta-lactamase class C family)
MRPLLAAFSLALIALTAPAQTLGRDVDRLAAITLSTWHVPGLAVAVVQDDRVVLAKGYGVKEIGGSDRVGADTLFQIGSTTKAFTTTAMAILADEKKLDWDDPVRKHLPRFHLSDPCADSLVTLRDIVSHRTGVARHDELWDNTALTRDEILHRVAFLKVSKPIRSAYQYNNIMFMAAGEVVASAGKMPWDDFVRARIFEPLGMSHTRTLFADWAPSDHALGHRWLHNQITLQPIEDETALAPAGTIMSSANDMARWLRFQLAGGTIDGKRIVSAEALAVTRTPLMPIPLDRAAHELNPFSNVQSYAMGWNVSDYRGELLVSHAGALNGFRAQVAFLPYRNAGVVVMINVGRGYAGAALRNAILDLLLAPSGAAGFSPPSATSPPRATSPPSAPARDWNAAYADFEKAAEALAVGRVWQRESKRKPDAKPTHDLAAYAGTYHDPAYGDAVVAVENGALVVRWNNLTLPLVHSAYDTFTAVSETDDVDETVQFKLAPDGAVQSFTLFGEEFVKP